MSAKSFLIAHGEKLAVVVIAAGCAYVVYDHASDPGFRPKEDSAKIDAINANIDKVFNSQEPPVIKPSRPYLDQLLTRLGEQPAITPTIAWLTTPPDLSKTKPGDVPYFYIYELPAPTVTLRDVVGELEITVQVEADAKAPAGSGRRVSAEAERSWTRTAATGQVVNSAHHLGICIEVKIGENGEFKPLVLPGATKDGILPLTALNTPITFVGAEPWQKHFVRARLVAAATSFDPKTTELRPLATVLVMPGHLSSSLADDQKLIGGIEDQWRQLKKGAGPDWAKVLAPETSLALPAGVQVLPNERVFRGPPAIEKQVVTGSVRFALAGLGTEMDDKGQPRDVARFKFLKRFIQGEQSKWLERPIDQKCGVGEKLGSVIKGKTPYTDKTVDIDLQTPFVVDKIVKAQPRVLYWIIKTKARVGGGKDRDLELDKREKPTDIVVLKNPASGNEMTLTKLDKVNPPPQTKVVVYPFRAGPVDELEEFTKAPTEFQQYDLVPAEPKSHEPGRGPLASLYAKKKAESAPDLSIYQTDTTYYELADGRLVWWEVGNHELTTHDPNGIEKPAGKDAAPAPAPAPAPVPGPASKVPPGPTGPPAGAMPPGMPPGMIPPGGMPPGHAPPTPPKR